MRNIWFVPICLLFTGASLFSGEPFSTANVPLHNLIGCLTKYCELNAQEESGALSSEWKELAKKLDSCGMLCQQIESKRAAVIQEEDRAPQPPQTAGPVLPVGNTTAFPPATQTSGTAGGEFVLRAGDTMTGNLEVDAKVSIGIAPQAEELYVNGTSYAITVSGGTKPFIIAHPDPVKREKGYVLRHCSIEAPTGGDTLYRYQVEIDPETGRAEIQLPDYFPYLNENPQVWVSGTFSTEGGIASAEYDVESNKVFVSANSLGVYNVLVIATRKDPLAQEYWAKGGAEYIPEA